MLRWRVRCSSPQRRRVRRSRSTRCSSRPPPWRPNRRDREPLRCRVFGAVGPGQRLYQHRSAARVCPLNILRSIGGAGADRLRVLGRWIAAALPIALNASTLRAADLDVELIHNFYPREWTWLALGSVVESVSVDRRFGSRVGAFIAGELVRRGPLGRDCRPSGSTGTRRRSFKLWHSSIPASTICSSGTRYPPIGRGRGPGPYRPVVRSFARYSSFAAAPHPARAPGRH